MITLLEARAQTSIMVSMKVGEKPVLAVWRRFIRFPAKLVHHKASAWHQLPVRQPQRSCPSWALPGPMAPVTALTTDHVTGCGARNDYWAYPLGHARLDTGVRL